MNSYEHPDREILRCSAEVLNSLLTGEVQLETVSSVAERLDITKQRVSKMAETGKMPLIFFRTTRGTPLWLPSQIIELEERRLIVK